MSQPIYFPVFSAVLCPHCFSLFLFFFLRIQSYFCSLLFLFTCFFKPLVLQALLSRGVAELLLTSDGSDGLKFGGVEGGTVGWTRLCTLTHTNTRAVHLQPVPVHGGFFFFLHAPTETFLCCLIKAAFAFRLCKNITINGSHSWPAC